MSSGYNEADLSEKARDVHRVLASLQEELEAIDYYNQRIDRGADEAMKAVLAHNRDEEVEHASMLMEWLRRNMPPFAEAMKTYLFTSAPITELEAGTAAGAGDDAGLGIKDLK
jgi:uncharacterized protein